MYVRTNCVKSVLESSAKGFLPKLFLYSLRLVANAYLENHLDRESSLDQISSFETFQDPWQSCI